MIVITIFLILVLIFIIINLKKKNHFTNFYRCDKRNLGKITSKIFKKHNLVKNNKTD